VASVDIGQDSLVGGVENPLKLSNMKNYLWRFATTILLVSFFLTAAPSVVDAKFWRPETITTPYTAADGKCWKRVEVTYYVFWIPVSTSSEYVPC